MAEYAMEMMTKSLMHVSQILGIKLCGTHSTIGKTVPQPRVDN